MKTMPTLPPILSRYQFFEKVVFISKVPAGVLSLYDDSLAEDFVYKFDTKTLKVNKWVPMSLETLTPTFVVEFDQLVDSQEILKVIKISNKKMLGKHSILFTRNLPD